MELSLSVPDSVGQRLHGHWADLPRRALEAVVLEAYREGALTEAEVQQTLGFESLWAAESFLKKAHAWRGYTEEDLQKDLETLRGLRRR